MLISIVAAGTIGLELIEGWGFMDALYMTVITISTDIAQDVIQKWPNRIDLELLYRLKLWFSVFTGLRGVRICPDMLLQRIH